MKFQEKDSWSLHDLALNMKMCSFVLRKKLSFWKLQGILEQVEGQSGAGQATSEQMDTNANATEVYALVKEPGKVRVLLCKRFQSQIKVINDINFIF